MGRLIIVSNRLPYTIEKTNNEVAVRQSSGGLVSAIKSFFDKQDTDSRFAEKLWVGSMAASEEDWLQAKQSTSVKTDFTVEPIFIDEQLYNDYYNGFSNSCIWPLFHYFPSLVEYKREHFTAYTAVNGLFAERIAQLYQPGDVVWVHDYQLMLLPQMLRERLRHATIGFFLHIPFPSYEILRLLPTSWRKSLLDGLLGADLVGFHTHDYSQHFIQSAKMILRLENQFTTLLYRDKMVKVEVFPIGIDYQKFRDAIIDDSVVAICTSLEEKFYNQKLIFSVDRLDYTKGLNYRLEGYELFLENYPEWKEKVVFILNVIPSRDLIPTYLDRKRMIEEKVSYINGKYSTLHWQPLIYRYNHLDFDELCALYQEADVALITPLRDGMNLVAKEYVASCIDKGVLVLSELTGAANELGEAIMVNPTDVDEVAEAIQSALTMPLVEQRSRLSYMQRRLAEYNVVKWIDDFLECLDDAKKDQENLRVHLLNEKTMQQIQHDYVLAKKRCLLLDYDGTLAPYHKIPSHASPSNELLQLLRELTDEANTDVVIVSGRDAKTLEKWLGGLQVHLIAEHGASIRLKNDMWRESIEMSTEWKDRIRPLMQMFVNRCAGSFIEEKKSTLAWHYRNCHPEMGFSRSRELKNSLLQLITNTPLQLIDGNKVLEVRMMGVDKGTSSVGVVNDLRPDFIICVGDDTTDEDMFRMIRDRGYTIKVGYGNTAAEYTIPQQKDVYPLLRRLLQHSIKQVPQ